MVEIRVRLFGLFMGSSLLGLVLRGSGRFADAISSLCCSVFFGVLCDTPTN